MDPDNTNRPANQLQLAKELARIANALAVLTESQQGLVAKVSNLQGVVTILQDSSTTTPQVDQNKDAYFSSDDEEEETTLIDETIPQTGILPVNRNEFEATGFDHSPSPREVIQIQHGTTPTQGMPPRNPANSPPGRQTTVATPRQGNLQPAVYPQQGTLPKQLANPNLWLGSASCLGSVPCCG